MMLLACSCSFIFLIVRPHFVKGYNPILPWYWVSTRNKKENAKKIRKHILERVLSLFLHQQHLALLDPEPWWSKININKRQGLKKIKVCLIPYSNSSCATAECWSVSGQLKCNLYACLPLHQGSKLFRLPLSHAQVISLIT